MQPFSSRRIDLDTGRSDEHLYLIRYAPAACRLCHDGTDRTLIVLTRRTGTTVHRSGPDDTPGELLSRLVLAAPGRDRAWVATGRTGRCIATGPTFDTVLASLARRYLRLRPTPGRV